MRNKSDHAHIYKQAQATILPTCDGTHHELVNQASPVDNDPGISSLKTVIAGSRLSRDNLLPGWRDLRTQPTLDDALA